MRRRREEGERKGGKEEGREEGREKGKRDRGGRSRCFTQGNRSWQVRAEAGRESKQRNVGQFKALEARGAEDVPVGLRRNRDQNKMWRDREFPELSQKGPTLLEPWLRGPACQRRGETGQESASTPEQVGCPG